MKKTTKAKHERNNPLHSHMLPARGRLLHRLAECNDTQVRVGVDDLRLCQATIVEFWRKCLSTYQLL